MKLKDTLDMELLCNELKLLRIRRKLEDRCLLGTERCKLLREQDELRKERQTIGKAFNATPENAVAYEALGGDA